MALAGKTTESLKLSALLERAIQSFRATLDRGSTQEFDLRSKRSLNSAETPVALAALAGRGSEDDRIQTMAPRLVRTLSNIQLFSYVLTVYSGGSQKDVLSSVWNAARIAFEFASISLGFFDDLTRLIIDAAKSCPDPTQHSNYQFDASGLPDLLYEYLIAIVHICKDVMIFMAEPESQRELKGSFENMFGGHRKRLRDCGELIRQRELSASAKATQVRHVKEAAGQRETARTHRMRAKIRPGVSTESGNLVLARQRRKRYRVLAKCAEHDPQQAWNQARKLGNPRWILDNEAYRRWNSEDVSARLKCCGSVGSGKTILSAYVIEDLSWIVGPQDCICYHFCRSDAPKTKTKRAVLGSLVRQMVNFLPDPYFDQLEVPQDIDNVQDLVFFFKQSIRPLLESLHLDRVYFVVDGFVGEPDNASIYADIVELIPSFTWKFFFTDSHSSRRHEISKLVDYYISIDSMRPDQDLQNYAVHQLYRALSDGRCEAQDTDAVNAAAKRLVTNSDGMFLCLHLQLQDVCLAQSCEEILKKVDTLPTGLTATYDHVLEKLNLLEKSKDVPERIFQRLIQIMAASQRNLMLNEIQEALRISPGNFKWSSETLETHLQQLVCEARGLITLDKETCEVAFAHYTLLQHLQNTTFYSVSIREANMLLGKICITYLQLKHDSPRDDDIQSMDVDDLPTGSSDSTENSAKKWNLARKLFKGRTKRSPDLEQSSPPVNSLVSDSDRWRPVHLADYVSKFWFHHAKSFVEYREGKFVHTDRKTVTGLLFKSVTREHLDSYFGKLGLFWWQSETPDLDVAEATLLEAKFADFVREVLAECNYAALLAIIGHLTMHESPTMFSIALQTILTYGTGSDANQQSSDTHMMIPDLLKESVRYISFNIWSRNLDCSRSRRSEYLCVLLYAGYETGRCRWIAKSAAGSMADSQQAGRFEWQLIWERLSSDILSWSTHLEPVRLQYGINLAVDSEETRNPPFPSGKIDPGLVLAVKGESFASFSRMLDNLKYDYVSEEESPYWPGLVLGAGGNDVDGNCVDQNGAVTKMEPRPVLRLFVWLRAAIICGGGGGGGGSGDANDGAVGAISDDELLSLVGLDDGDLLARARDNHGWHIASYAARFGRTRLAQVLAERYGAALSARERADHDRWMAAGGG